MDPFKRCISLASLFKALERSDFYIRKETKSGVLEYGPLWTGDNEKTLTRTVTVMKGWLGKMKDGAPEWWNLGSGEGGGFAMNDSITACVNALRSVLVHLETSGRKLIHLTHQERAQAVALSVPRSSSTSSGAVLTSSKRLSSRMLALGLKVARR